MGEQLSSAPIINLEEMRQNWCIGGDGGTGTSAGCSGENTPASTTKS